jgi:hypothetical protein
MNKKSVSILLLFFLLSCSFEVLAGTFNLYKNTMPESRIEVYQKLAASLGQEEALKKYAMRRYPKNHYGKEITKSLIENLGGKFLVLVVDAGLVFHYDEFLKIALELKYKNNTKFLSLGPWELRAYVEKKLGTVKLYHAKLLDKGQDTKLLVAPALYHYSVGSISEDVLEKAFDESIQTQYKKRFFGNSKENMLLSLTEYQDFGVGVVYDDKMDFSKKEISIFSTRSFIISTFIFLNQSLSYGSIQICLQV